MKTRKSKKPDTEFHLYTVTFERNIETRCYMMPAQAKLAKNMMGVVSVKREE